MTRKEMYERQKAKSNKEKMWDAVLVSFVIGGKDVWPELEEVSEGLLETSSNTLFIFCDDKTDAEITEIAKESLKKYEKTVLCTFKDGNEERRLKELSPKCGFFGYADYYGLGMCYNIKY